ncbi:hypothetical protein CW731_05710 [Polaribacter sp. ALD11]|uniref:hypothetical protein n=1 Tax=Polaribacter sp. ALD11 TaxID=2058137 RepID=UPI000C30BC97|nr:hypothetical protein [Polaribacter sp. ALD11]AUC84819.1 hypothetical protein CW731_05710 [Polaribacter sp. ALD11]
MKKMTLSIIIITLFYYNSTLAQENKLQLKSTSLGIGLSGLSSDNTDISDTSTAGFTVNLDLSVNLNKHIFSLYLNKDFKFNLYDGREHYNQLNATYGREFELNDWLKLEGHLGLGYFNYSVKNYSTDFKTNKESTIGFPLRVKLIFYTKENFGIGINPNLNLNSLVNTYSVNIVFQHNF